MAIEEWTQFLTSPLALLIMAGLVFGDAFTVVLPGEAAVTAMGAVALESGRPPLAAVVAVAWAAALAGDVSCYAVGRATRIRHRVGGRLRTALEQAEQQLQRRGAVILFTARFVPFARLAVNLVAGAAHTPVRIHLPLVALAALGWALVQALLGAALAVVLPGGPLVAVVVSVAAALVLGLIVDTAASALRRLRRSAAGEP